MKTILFPTDFSDASENAALYIMGLAEQVPIENIILLHSFAPKGPGFAQLTELMDPIIVIPEDSEIEGIKKLESFKKFISHQNTRGVGISILADERPLEVAIPDIVIKRDIDIVVSGIEPFGKTTDRSTGTNAIKIAIELEVPVLIIPADVSYQPIHTVLLACDLKDIKSSLPKEMLAKLLKDLNARLLVLNIDYENRNFSALTILEQSELHHALDHTGAEYFYIEDKDTSSGIIRFAEEKKVQIIINIPKEQGVFTRLFNPSVTKRLAAISPLPIMLIHS